MSAFFFLSKWKRENSTWVYTKILMKEPGENGEGLMQRKEEEVSETAIIGRH